MKRERVIVAMSGGVDSAVAAALLVRHGYEVIGVTMRLWTIASPDAPLHQRGCCSVDDSEDARQVCQVLNIPHYVLNLEDDFRRHVVEYFCREYESGRTPNPCLACNDQIKFRIMLSKALALEADYLATGHYVRSIRNEEGHELRQAADAGKDQSYVLYMLKQRELSRLLFPIGEYTKAEVRRMAAEFGLPVADKPDSADICFIPGGDYRAFISEYVTAEPGDIVDSSGRALGRHNGIAGYTVGQRRGLGIAGDRPMYVLQVRAGDNTVVVGSEEELMVDVIQAQSLSFVAGEAPIGPVRVEVKARYRSGTAPAVLTVTGDEGVIALERPLRAVTPGQAVVFYHGDMVLGGGIIAYARRSERELPPARIAVTRPAAADSSVASLLRMTDPSPSRARLRTASAVDHTLVLPGPPSPSFRSANR